MITTPRKTQAESLQLPESAELSGSGDDSGLESMLDHTLRTRHDFWIQTIRSSTDGSDLGIYLSTFQKGRGQHLTTLTPLEARVLGERLIGLAREVDAA